jgi:hypothetical protein
MFALAAALTAALPMAVSPAAEHTALTVYRAPSWMVSPRMDMSGLNGFALITETRTIVVPAGQAVLRFEGVADGIIPATALVTGLPGGTIEKNRDARLLSPASLVDGTLGRDVTVRRFDKKSGMVREERATVIAVPTAGQGGVIFRTSEGFETWRCPGVPEKLAFDGVPPGLSAKPVLSVTTNSPQAARTRVTLSYLASGFDWRANYVATLAPTGTTLDLFAWATIANANGQAFPATELQVVAGRLQREAVREILAKAAMLELRCFRMGTTTSDLPVISPYRWGYPSRRYEEGDEIVVTAMRAPPAMVAAAPPAPPPPPPEDLGDLKLFRVPEPVTVSANGQKQVALLSQHNVTFEKVYRISVQPWMREQELPATILLRMKNVQQAGLGLPLPAGGAALYQQREATRLLVGLGMVGDVAKNERIDLSAGLSRQVFAVQRIDGAKRHITLSNANPIEVTVEIAIGRPGDPALQATNAPLARIDGVQTWRVTVSGNSSVQLDYAILER